MKESLDSSDDPVVYEADVTFAPKRKGDFYLFQFSHNSSPFSVKKQCLGSIKAKPRSNQFEIELLMNPQSNTFDQDKSKRIAFNVDDSQPKNDDDKEQQEKFFPECRMDKQLLNSEKLTSTGFHFAIGYLRENLKEVKLIPIKSVLEFKPAFRYLDKVKIKTSNKNQEESEEEDEQEFTNSSAAGSKKGDQTTKQITMRFEDKHDKKKAADKEHQIQQDIPENEHWVNVQYFDYGLAKFEREKDVVLYKINQEAMDDTPVLNDDDKKFSYEEFARKDLHNENTAPPQAGGGELKIDLLNTLPFYQTSSLPLKDQIRSILCSSKVISFNKCLHLLELNLEKNRLTQSTPSSQQPRSLDPDLVLRYLQQYAILVQGNWVVKSEIIYPKTFNSSSSFDLNSIPFTNISIEMLCKARDYVLYKFTQEQSLSRLELIEQIRVPADVIGEILLQFSSFNKQSRSWDFVYPRDEEFLSKYEEIVKRQEIQWEATSNQLLNLFG